MLNQIILIPLFIFQLMMSPIKADVKSKNPKQQLLTDVTGLTKLANPVCNFEGPGNCDCGCIFLFPGLTEPSTYLNLFKCFIQTDFPCAKVVILNDMGGLFGFLPVWTQVEQAREFFEPYFHVCPNITAIGHSLGGLVARGLIESTPNHNFTTLINIAVPNMGCSFLPLVNNLGSLTSALKDLTADGLCHFFYSNASKGISLGGYYRCTGRDANGTDLYQEYLNNSEFLPYANNEKRHANNTMYKKNFIKLKTIVNVQIPNDTIVSPAISEHWGTLENGTYIEMKKQKVFIEDSFGLQTLYKRNAIVLLNSTGTNHVTIMIQDSAYQLIKPYLCVGMSGSKPSEEEKVSKKFNIFGL